MDRLGQRPPSIRAPIPGARGAEYVERLAASECPALTARRARRSEESGARHDPIVWSEASGANVVDVDGNRYVDLTSGFGVAAIGHRHPAVLRAIEAQSARLLHALGDLGPSDRKVELLERLSQLGPWPKAKVILGSSGSDAVEAALKTAALATGRPGVLAFEGGYHGLGHGPLAACGYKEAFRQPFAAQLNPHVRFAPFPTEDEETLPALDAAEEALRSGAIGAVLVEPVQGRAGVRIPPSGFLGALADRAKAHGALLVVDEIFTGLGRSGSMLRAVADGVSPDLICIGKALGGGLPVSACLGSEESMEAWGAPGGEAIHTGTFFGHPLACATALATLEVLAGEKLLERSARLGARICARLGELLPSAVEVRGVGLMIGIELDAPGAALRVMRSMIEKGYLVLPAGADASVVQLLPPLTIAEERLDEAADALASAVEARDR